MDEKTNALFNRLVSLSDKDLLKILSEDSQMYNDETIQLTQQIAHSRGLLSNFVESEFKVITAGGRENGPLDILTIKELFHKNLINDESLLFVDSKSQWIPLKKVFPLEFWATKIPEKDESKSITNISPVVEERITDLNEPTLANNVPTSIEPSTVVEVKRKNSETDSRYIGIGGWLLFFIFQLVIGSILGLIYGNEMLRNFTPEGYKFYFAILLIRTGLAITIAIILVSKSRLAPLFTIIYLVFSLLEPFVMMFLTEEFGDRRMIDVEGTVSQIKASMQVSLPLIIMWIFYFIGSKRVKATYYP